MAAHPGCLSETCRAGARPAHRTGGVEIRTGAHVDMVDEQAIVAGQRIPSRTVL
jgi:hypothetical protein